MGNLLQKVSTEGMLNDWKSDLREYLSEPNIAFIVEQGLAHVADATPLLIASLRHDVLPGLWRRPVGLAENAF